MGRVKTIPNFLTILRIAFLPFIVIFIVKKKLSLALLFFIISAITDFLDGYIARKNGCITNLGILLDPIADKLLTSSTLISLAYVKMCDPFSVILIVGREEAVTGMRAIAATRGLVIPASYGGKIKTFLIMVSITLLLAGEKFLGEILLIISAIVAIYTGVLYFVNFLKVLGEENG
ncbi:MAG: CDP-diacylglycerol--glycerol-3-phosphate 3-phosphatidyltransferase [Desulfurobacteriaceae bacterium]